MGYVEIIPGWNDANLFTVMDWSESGDSGWCAGTFRNRSEAVKFALSYATENRRELPSATIIPFPKAGGAR